jgi:chromosome segregation ATPase
MTTVYIALKETNETMDRELNNLKYENDRLEIEVKKLEASVSHLKDMEHTLATLRNMERISLDDLQTQLHQSQEILNQLEVCSRFLSLYILYTCCPWSESSSHQLINL